MGYGRGEPRGKVSRHYSPQQKVAILREHLIEQVPISELCEKHHIHPTVIRKKREQAISQFPG